MPERRFFDSSQPQTLQGAVMLSYLNVAFAVLSLLIGGLLWVILLQLAEGAGAYGIANEKRWGYLAGIGASLAILAISVWLFVAGHGIGIISLLFSVVLVALLLHPQSREYQRIWFH